jgi:hypothetical protein
MAKPARSPVLGYNHNVRYHGRVFHVQTEDSGPTNPRLYTHLFHAGTILSSKKQEYEAAAPEDSVKGLMQRLHKAMIKELTQGTHDERIAAFFIARGEAPNLDPPAATGTAAAPVEIKAIEVLKPPEARTPEVRPADDRPLPVSGSIDANSGPHSAPPVGPAPAVVVSAMTPAPVLVSAPPLAAAPPAASAHSAPPPARPQVPVRPVVVPEVRRSPVVLSSSADGAVVQRNVVISVGGSPPVPSERDRATRQRSSVPFSVREGSHAPPIAPRVAGAAPTQTHSEQTQPLASGRDVRMPPSARAPEQAGRPRQTAALGVDRVPWVSPPSDRPPRGPSGERTTPDRAAFAANLVSDKSLDEVILEYLSDDGESEER